MRVVAFLVLALGSLLLAGCDCSGSLAMSDAGALDGSRLDASMRDASMLDSGPRDGGSDGGCLTTQCGATERCYDGIDNDCDGTVDEECACAPGSTTRCLPPSLDPAASICAWGQMVCEGSGEFGNWGPCTGGGGGDAGASPYGCRRIGIMGAPGANPSSNFQSWLTMQGAIATRFHASAAAPTLQRAELETFDLVIVDWLQRQYTTEEATTLATWVREGGALMVMTGHDSGATADRHVSLLSQLGPTYDLAAGPLDGPATLIAHPTTRTSGGTGTLPPITFYGGLRTIVPAPLTGDIVPMAEIRGETVGVAGPLGMGSVLLFGDEWIEFDSEWSTMPPIIEFWLNTVTWLSPNETLVICQ
ncbi:MAG: putative metal-binding motif-containing protein [Sandaracinaceae bacterium]|nr:putative metal-binding motif-containing protein [Sandaracinaceae bacterium]